MMTWKEAAKRALLSGSAASALSGGTLALFGKLERNAPAGPLNGPSQWVWGTHAARRRRLSARETLVGYAIHHGVSIGWATVHEKHVASLLRSDSFGARLLAGAATAGIACFMDYAVAHGRLRPGFEVQLSRKALFFAYSAFAVGLAMGTRPRPRERAVFSRPRGD